MSYMEIIYHDHANKSGVYKIYNKLNGRIYIGSAKTFKTRISDHIKSLRANKHSNKFLQADFNKCGEEAFAFEILEIIEGDKKSRTRREKELIEKYWDRCKDCYNIQKDPDSIDRSCFSKTPEETKKLISENSKAMWANLSEKERKQRVKNATASRTKETYEKVSKALIGIKRSAEAIEKNRQKSLGKKHGSHTEEAKQKMALNRKNRKEIKVIQGETVNIFPSISATARFLNISIQSVCNALNKKYKQGYKTAEYVIEQVNI